MLKAVEMNRIKSLDGIRAISILMVLLGHARETMPEYITGNPFFIMISNSSLGVSIFFVISGYLITRLLIKERVNTGAVDIKDFYMRRIYRIFPVFYLYIFVVLVIKHFFVTDIFTDSSLPKYAGLYLWNYKHLFSSFSSPDNGFWFFGHFWSLSMEEQFYMFWPLMFIKARKLKLKKILIGFVLMIPIARVLTYAFMPESRGQIGIMLHTGGDAILLGCLGAIFENSKDAKNNLIQLLESKYLIISSAIFLFVVSPALTFYLEGMYSLTIGMTLNNICIMILIFWSIYVPSKLADFLNAKPVMYIGFLSYSLYIWQQLFLTNIYDSWVHQFPQNLVLVFVVACLSYHLIEKPILGLKKRTAKRENTLRKPVSLT